LRSNKATTQMPDALTISAGDSICGIYPCLGGSIASWTVGGQPMLMSASPEAAENGDVTCTGSFPLLPYSNRIAYGRFALEDENFQLPPHPTGYPHANHGVGWLEQWAVKEHRTDRISLLLDFGANAHWPWPFRAEQSFEIGEDSLTLTLSATNTASGTVPLAFGHHPQFDSAGARLRFSARSFYPTQTDGLPGDPLTPPPDVDFSNMRSVGGCLIDNIYGGWNGDARIEWEGRHRALEISSSLPHAVLYTPVESRFFCFEPVPHLINALNRVDGDMPMIAPTESITAQIQLRAVPLEPGPIF
jgi:aldose 1-epimerase